MINEKCEMWVHCLDCASKRFFKTKYELFWLCCGNMLNCTFLPPLWVCSYTCPWAHELNTDSALSCGCSKNDTRKGCKTQRWALLWEHCCLTPCNSVIMLLVNSPSSSFFECLTAIICFTSPSYGSRSVKR